MLLAKWLPLITLYSGAGATVGRRSFSFVFGDDGPYTVHCTIPS